MSVTTSVDLKAEPSAVWSVLSDLGGLGNWITNHAGFVGAAPGRAASGVEYTEKLRVLGMPSEVRWTIAGVDDGRSITQEGKGPMGISIDGHYALEPANGGTRLTVSQSFSGATIFAVKGQLEREVKTVQEASLEKLRAMVESV